MATVKTAGAESRSKEAKSFVLRARLKSILRQRFAVTKYGASSNSRSIIAGHAVASWPIAKSNTVMIATPVKSALLPKNTANECARSEKENMVL